MNAVLDAAVNTNEEIGFNKFVAECVEMNRDMVITTIQNMKKNDPSYIIDTIVFKIITTHFINKSHQELVEAIAGGSIFQLKDALINAFHNDVAVKEVTS